MGLVETYKIQVRFGDTDCTGRIYFTAYARWADDAVIEFLRLRGLSYDPSGRLCLDKRRIEETFVVGEYSCRMDRPSHYDELLVLKVTLAEVRRRTARFLVTLHQAGTKQQCARVELTYVCIPPSTRRSADIRRAVAKRFLARASTPRKNM